MIKIRLPFAWTLGAGVLSALLSCGPSTQPPSRPATRMYDRSMAQLGVVELVVKDPVRAHRTKALLEGVEEAFLQAESERSAAAARAFGMSQSGEPSDDEIRAAFATMDEASGKALDTYVGLQLELRKVLTRKEFDRLLEVR